MRFLTNYSGYLHVDGYQGYKKLEPQGVTIVECWAHTRRKFHDALKALEKADRPNAAANIGYEFCNRLFKLERQFDEGNLTFEQKLKKRITESKPIAENFFDWASKQLSKPTTIPGIGNTLGAIILSEIGDINRFDAPNKLVAFAGLDVKVSQSGEFIGTKNKISKRRSPYLRRAIWLAAGRAAFCDPVLSEYYQSLKVRGKHHLTAVGAVARKLCNIIFVILRENRPYAKKVIMKS